MTIESESSVQIGVEQRVGIRELRHDFRAYIDRVRRGERFIVTDHGVPVGEFVPHEPKKSVLQRMIDEGRATPATRKLEAAFEPTEQVTSILSDALAEMRDSERML